MKNRCCKGTEARFSCQEVLKVPKDSLNNLEIVFRKLSNDIIYFCHK